jgi:hypothetical protein
MSNLFFALYGCYYTEKGKDWMPFNRLLEMIRKFDGLRIYRFGNKD